MHQVDSVETGIVVSHLYRQLGDLMTRSVHDVRSLLRALLVLEGVAEEFGMIFEEEGINTPQMLETYREAEIRITAAHEWLTRMERTPAMRGQAILRAAHLGGHVPSDEVLVAAEPDPTILRLANIHQIIMRQSVTVSVPGARSILSLPGYVLDALQSRNVGMFEQIEGTHDVRVLESALALWEPYHEGAEFESFSNALEAATRLG